MALVSGKKLAAMNTDKGKEGPHPPQAMAKRVEKCRNTMRERNAGG
jgi:hypothetical protein